MRSILLVLLLLSSPAAAQQNVPVLRAGTSFIDVRNGEVSRARYGLRPPQPEAPPSVIRAELINGRPHRVVVSTDLDSIGFLVEEGGHYDFRVQRGDTINHLRLVGERLVPAPGVEADRVRLVANPERVCFDERVAPYLNFDLILRNGTEHPIRVRELRAFVLDPAGELLERRVVAQQTLALLGPDLDVPPLGERLLFNPFAFHSVRPDSRVRYELHLTGVAPPLELMVTPQPCLTRARLILPLAGRIAIYSGHDLLAHHRRYGYLGAGGRAAGMIDNFQRFGLDLVVVDPQGRAFRGDGTRNEEWLSWGQPVRAAGVGTVAAVRDGQPDNTVIGSENLWTPRPLSEDEMAMAGNYVLIDHGDGEFSLTSHLKNGSVRVRTGDRVQAGDTIGEVGNSGASLHPHVHYELRSGTGVRGVRALPAYFLDLTVIGTGEGRDGRAVRVNTGDVLVAR